MCRVALDGKEGDVPPETWARIVCVLRYTQYHGSSDGHYDFPLCSNAYWATLKTGRLCIPHDYPYLFFFKCCAELQLQGVPGFLDDPVVQPMGKFLTNQQLLRKKCAEDLQVVKVTPLSVLCKQLWDTNNYPEEKDICAVALAAFGIIDAAIVRAVQD